MNITKINGDNNYYQSYQQYDYQKLIQLELLNKAPIPHLTECSATEKWIPFHRVPFKDALYLIKQRKVYLQNGYALVPNYLFYLVVEEKYRRYLGNKLKRIQSLNLLNHDFLQRHPKLNMEINKIKHILNGFAMKQISMGKYLNMKEERKRNGLRNKLVHDKIGLEYMKYFPLCIRFIFNSTNIRWYFF